MDHVDWHLSKYTVAWDFIIESIKTTVNNNSTINRTGLHLTDKGERLFCKSARGGGSWSLEEGGGGMGVYKSHAVGTGGYTRLEMLAGNCVV